MNIHDQNYNEIIQLFMEFKKMEDDNVALGFLQSTIKEKIRDYTRGMTLLSDLIDGDKCILLPMNGFDCCRNDGINHQENGYRLFEKYTDEKGRARVKDVYTQVTIMFVFENSQVLKIL